MITFRNPAFLQKAQAYIEPARAYPQIWRVFAGVALLFVVYLGVTFLLPVATTLIWGADAFASFISGFDKLDTRPEAIFVLVSFVGMFVGAILAAIALHKRGLKSLLGASTSRWWALFLAGMIGIWLYQIAAIAGTTAFVSADEELIQQHPVGDWVSWLPLLLLLLLLQVSSEELVFRGYLQQQLASLSKNRWVWWIVPSLLFGALHFQPSTFGSNAWIVVGVTTIIGLVAADITMRTGSLWAAIGLHFGNNLSGLALFAQKGMLSGFSLYLSPLDLSNEAAVRPLLLAQLICALIAFAVYMLIAERMRRD